MNKDMEYLKFPVIVDDLPLPIVDTEPIQLDFGFDQEAMLKSARIRDAINSKAARLFYQAHEVGLYYRMDANLLYGDRILKPWADALAS